MPFHCSGTEHTYSLTSLSLFYSYLLSFLSSFILSSAFLYTILTNRRRSSDDTLHRDKVHKHVEEYTTQSISPSLSFPGHLYAIHSEKDFPLFFFFRVVLFCQLPLAEVEVSIQPERFSLETWRSETDTLACDFHGREDTVATSRGGLEPLTPSFFSLPIGSCS